MNQHEASEAGVILRFAGEHAFLSNFHPCFLYTGRGVYRTVEHYYQAHKTNDLAMHSLIQHAKTPGDAKRLGQRATLRPDWEQMKEFIMWEGLRGKFSHPDLRDKLIATCGHQLIEGNTWGDVYWGQCNGVGQNRLGELLMRVRSLCLQP